MVSMSSGVIGGMVNITAGIAMFFACVTARRRNIYVDKTTNVLIRWRLSDVDRKQTFKRVRWMLGVGMGFGLLVAALGVASLVVSVGR
jgi:uncharacterized membrane protein